MKKILFALAIIVGAFDASQAQSENYDFTKMTFRGNVPVYDKVVELGADYTKDVLYRNAKAFFANAFADSKSVIRIDNKEDGQVMGKGGILFTWHYLTNHDNLERFSLEILVKDGRYRYRIYDVSVNMGFLQAYFEMAMNGKVQGRNFYEGLYYANEALISQLQVAMSAKPINNNW